MHKYPIFYFSILKDEIQPEQIGRLLYFEKEAGDVKLDTGIEGLKFDFNAGARLEVPEGNWHIKISDFDTGLVGFDGDISQQVLVSLEKYYVHWFIEAWLDGEKVFEHLLDLHSKNIYIFMVNGVLGDTISVLPYINELKRIYNANIYLYPPKSFVPLCEEYMPDINLTEKIPDDCYVSFCLAVFDLPPYLIPDDSRRWPPYMSAKTILGLHQGRYRKGMSALGCRLLG